MTIQSEMNGWDQTVYIKTIRFFSTVEIDYNVKLRETLTVGDSDPSLLTILFLISLYLKWYVALEKRFVPNYMSFYNTNKTLMLFLLLFP